MLLDLLHWLVLPAPLGARRLGYVGDSVRLASFTAHNAAAHIVYSASPADVRDVWVGGKQIVKDFAHVAIGDVPAALRAAIATVVTL